MQGLSGPDYSPGPAYAVGSHLQETETGASWQAAMEARKSGTGPKYLFGAYDPTDIYSSTATTIRHCRTGPLLQSVEQPWQLASGSFHRYRHLG